MFQNGQRHPKTSQAGRHPTLFLRACDHQDDTENGLAKRQK